MELHSFTVGYLDALRSGDPLIGQHFASYFKPLLVIKLRTRHCAPSDIDEICQETFARVLSRLRADAIREPSRFGAFVSAVCDNVLREFYRSARRAAPLDEETAVDVHPVLDLDARLVTEQDRRRVRSVLQQLKPRDRNLLRALFGTTKDKDDICREHGVDRDYLRVLVHRAKNNFRALYVVSADGRRHEPKPGDR